LRLSILRHVLSLGGARGGRPAGRLAPENHRKLAIGLESEMLVEAMLVLREEDEHGHRGEVGMLDHATHQLASDSLVAVAVGHDDVPDRGAIGEIGDDAREADHAIAVPRRDHRMGVVQRPAHLIEGSLGAPPRDPVEPEELREVGARAVVEVGDGAGGSVRVRHTRRYARIRSEVNGAATRG
jgi:hypothetical protein